jgi:hypothetical protein
VIGREVSDWGDHHREEISWIGKPWRRVTLLTHRYFWREEQFDVERDLSFHLGLRRFGLFFTFTIAHQSGYDYSDEPQ